MKSLSRVVVILCLVALQSCTSSGYMERGTIVEDGRVLWEDGSSTIQYTKHIQSKNVYRVCSNEVGKRKFCRTTLHEQKLWLFSK